MEILEIKIKCDMREKKILWWLRKETEHFLVDQKKWFPLKYREKKSLKKKTKLDNTISTGQDSVIGVSKIQEPEYLKR